MSKSTKSAAAAAPAKKAPAPKKSAAKAPAKKSAKVRTPEDDPLSQQIGKLIDAAIPKKPKALSAENRKKAQFLARLFGSGDWVGDAMLMRAAAKRALAENSSEAFVLATRAADALIDTIDKGLERLNLAVVKDDVPHTTPKIETPKKAVVTDVPKGERSGKKVVSTNNKASRWTAPTPRDAKGRIQSKRAAA